MNIAIAPALWQALSNLKVCSIGKPVLVILGPILLLLETLIKYKYNYNIS